MPRANYGEQSAAHPTLLMDGWAISLGGGGGGGAGGGGGGRGERGGGETAGEEAPYAAFPREGGGEGSSFLRVARRATTGGSGWVGGGGGGGGGGSGGSGGSGLRGRRVCILAGCPILVGLALGMLVSSVATAWLRVRLHQEAVPAPLFPFSQPHPYPQPKDLPLPTSTSTSSASSAAAASAAATAAAAAAAAAAASSPPLVAATPRPASPSRLASLYPGSFAFPPARVEGRGGGGSGGGGGPGRGGGGGGGGSGGNGGVGSGAQGEAATARHDGWGLREDGLRFPSPAASPAGAPFLGPGPAGGATSQEGLEAGAYTHSHFSST